MHKVLFVTDDWKTKKSLKSELLERGFSVTSIPSAELFSETFAPQQPDVVVVDLERSSTDAAKICHTIKRERALKEQPLVFLVPEAMLGQLDFSWGIEDYLTLPVSGKRLAERLRFLLWKLNRVELKNGVAAGKLTIDFERYEVRVSGAPVDLTYKEFELLKCLATHPGKVFSREALLDKVWGYDYYGGTRTVDVHVRRLRSKIETHGASYIETIRHVGYKFLGPTS